MKSHQRNIANQKESLLTKAYNPFVTRVFFCPWTLNVWPFKNKPNFGHAFTYFWMLAPVFIAKSSTIVAYKTVLTQISLNYR